MPIEPVLRPCRSVALGRGRFRPGVLLACLLIGGLFATASARPRLNVLYAGSLVNLMEHGIGPAFARASGERVEGFAGGSKALAHQISGKLREADVFVSANPSVNARLMGPAHGAWVSWYVTFAQSPLVLGYRHSSRIAAQFRKRPWYRVLLTPGIRIGRTDPRLDPKGELTVELMQRAAKHYKIPDLAHRVLGAPDNPAQVLPEESLIGRLETGLIDVGFFYSTETTAAGIATVKLPAAITPKAFYTVTIVRDAPHPQAAERFIAFLLGAGGRRILGKYGLDLCRPELAGDAAAAPRSIRSLLESTR